MNLKHIAIALLCGTAMAAPLAPAFAQTATSTIPVARGATASPTQGVTTTTTTTGGPSTTAVIPAARDSTNVPGAPTMTTTQGAYAIGTRPALTTPPAQQTTTAATTTTAPMMSMVNINTATAAELDKLPQIGRARSAAIIKNRPYKTVDELSTRKVIPKGVYEKIKSQVTAG